MNRRWRLTNNEGWVYFIQAAHGGPIKIGSTSSEYPAARLNALQTGNPHKLVLIAKVRGYWNERDYHDRFASGRLEGEWFNDDTPGLRELIYELTTTKDEREHVRKLIRDSLSQTRVPAPKGAA